MRQSFFAHRRSCNRSDVTIERLASIDRLEVWATTVSCAGRVLSSLFTSSHRTLLMVVNSSSSKTITVQVAGPFHGVNVEDLARRMGKQSGRPFQDQEESVSCNLTFTFSISIGGGFLRV